MRKVVIRQCAGNVPGYSHWYERRGLCTQCNTKSPESPAGAFIIALRPRVMGGSTGATNCVLLHPESIVSVFPFRNRVSSLEAFEGLELSEGKPSRLVLRGPGGRKAAWPLGSCPETPSGRYLLPRRPTLSDQLGSDLHRGELPEGMGRPTRIELALKPWQVSGQLQKRRKWRTFQRF